MGIAVAGATNPRPVSARWYTLLQSRRGHYTGNGSALWGRLLSINPSGIPGQSCFPGGTLDSVSLHNRPARSAKVRTRLAESLRPSFELSAASCTGEGPFNPIRCTRCPVQDKAASESSPPHRRTLCQQSRLAPCCTRLRQRAAQRGPDSHSDLSGHGGYICVPVLAFQGVKACHTQIVRSDIPTTLRPCSSRLFSSFRQARHRPPQIKPSSWCQSSRAWSTTESRRLIIRIAPFSFSRKTDRLLG